MGGAHPHDQISKSNLGAENGYCGSDQLLIHVVNYGAWEGKQKSSRHSCGDPTDHSFRSILLTH